MNFLLDRPVALLIVLLIGAAIGMAVERYTHRAEAAERKQRWQNRRNSTKRPKLRTVTGRDSNQSPKTDYASDQLKVVSRAKFTARPLLNKSESKVFDTLDKAVIARNPAWQVMAQVSLGEFLGSPNEEAFRAVNSKRVDFALMDGNCRVVHALEYQGTGHNVSACAPARDAVKKEALRKAGIGYHEVVAEHTTPAELRALVERLVVEAS